MVIGERLRELRAEKNLTQADIQRRTGLVRPDISRIENGRVVPGLETLEKFARALEVPLYRLFHSGDKPPRFPAPLKRKDDLFGGRPGKDARFLSEFRQLLRRLDDRERRVLLGVAQEMAKRKS